MKAPSVDRYTTLAVCLGVNGCGKTTVIRRMVRNELQKPGGRVLVVTPDDREWTDVPLVHPRFASRIATYRGARRLIFKEGDLKLIADKFHSGLLVLDDCRTYLTANTDIRLHELLIRRRQRNIDMVVAAHGFTDVPPKIFTFATHFVLWRTRDNVAKRKDTILDYDRVAERVRDINAKGEKDIHYHEILKA